MSDIRVDGMPTLYTISLFYLRQSSSRFTSPRDKNVSPVTQFNVNNLLPKKIMTRTIRARESTLGIFWLWKNQFPRKNQGAAFNEMIYFLSTRYFDPFPLDFL